MIYGAVTFDAQTVVAAGYQFERGILSRFAQFKDGAIKIIISEMVYGEIEKKLVQSTRNLLESLNKAIRDAKKFHIGNIGEAEPPDAVEDADKVAKARLKEFVENIGAENISIERASLRDIVESYLRSLPPFQESGKKKQEFPDAIALFSLEKWADEMDTKVLAISGDGDWASYGEKSKRIDVEKDIDTALQKLQDSVREIKEKLKSLISVGSPKFKASLFEELKAKIGSGLEWSHLSGEANSRFNVEFWSFTHISVHDIFINFEDKNTVKIIEAGPGRIAATIQADVEIEASASFSFSTYDSVDKDEVPMGSGEASTEKNIEITFFIYIEGDFERNQIKIEDVDILKLPRAIHFGEIEPDWANIDNEASDFVSYNEDDFILAEYSAKKDPDVEF